MENILETIAFKESIQFLWHIVSVLVTRLWWAEAAAFLFLCYWIWLIVKRKKVEEEIKWVLLSISVPETCQKNPKSMEQVFAGFYGTRYKPNFYEKYLMGKQPFTMSLELIGIGGHVRFLIRCPIFFRDLVESHIYAQYPEAEITEVEDDYVQFIPDKYPNDAYDIFGAEFVLTKEDAYPIRTYPKFADAISREGFVDPVSSMTETLTKLTADEQVWLQIVIQPVLDNAWIEEGKRLVAKLIGKKMEPYTDWFQKTFVKGWHSVLGGAETILGIPRPESEAEESHWLSEMQFLSPGEREIVEAVEQNISKVAFKTKLRVIYVAKKDSYAVARGWAPTVGALTQFNTENLNGFKSHKKYRTKVEYFKRWREPRRKRRIMKYYKKRALNRGAKPFVFNIEELATIYHFPYVTVQAPTIRWTGAKKAEPPSDLPI